MRYFLFIYGLTTILIFYSCKNSARGKHYISEKDTSYNQDIRDISAKINASPDKADLYYKRGNAFYFLNKFKDASIDFEIACELDSTNSLYHYKCSESILQSDTANGISALKHLQNSIRLKPDYSDAKFLLGKYFLARQQYSDAEKILQTVVSNLDLGEKAIILLAISRKEQKDTAGALNLLKQCLAKNNNNYDAVMQMVSIKEQTNSPDLLQYIDKAILLNEFSAEAFYSKGLFLQKKEKYLDAIKHYEKASVLNPGHVLSYYNTAVAYSLIEDFKNCVVKCDKAIELRPQFANAFALKGFALEMQGNKKAALQSYKAALAIDPLNKQAQNGKMLLE